MPVATLAPEAIDLWLKHQSRSLRRNEISAWAQEIAGTALDLDRNLESAASEHLFKMATNSK